MKVKVGSLLTPHQEMIMRFTGFDSLLEEDLRALAPGQQASGKDSHTKTSFQGSSHALPSPTPSGMYTACRGRVVSSEVDPDAVSANSIVTPALSTHTEVRRLFLSQSQELAPTDMPAMGNLNLSAPPATLPPQTPAPKQASLAAVRDFM